MTADSTGERPNHDEGKGLKQEIERLNNENLLLRQRTEFEHLLAEHREKVADQLTQHSKDVITEINSRLIRLTALGALVVGMAWFSTLLPVRRLVTQRLDHEFASANIRGLIAKEAAKAAAAQTEEIIDTDLKPAVSSALSQIHAQSAKVSTSAQQFQAKTSTEIGQMRQDMSAEKAHETASMNALRDESATQLAKLKSVADYEQKLKDIQLLEGAMVQGDYSAFEKLSNYQSQDATLIEAAQSSALQGKSLYLFGSRTKGISLTWTYPNGGKVVDDKIPTGILESSFLLDQTKGWPGRAKGAELLEQRREIGVAEALLQAVQTDPNLWVRRAALRSFEGLTGYQETDVFDFGGAAAWWVKNKDSYIKTLQK